jgi:hypothetical protein
MIHLTWKSWDRRSNLGGAFAGEARVLDGEFAERGEYNAVTAGSIAYVSLVSKRLSTAGCMK